MYKSKKEVDTHVRTALSKLRSETERHLRSFTIARLYYKINEYATAEQYLTAYLSVKEDNDQAHKLLGQCYQRLKKPDKALQAFQRSLQLNAKQPDVLVEVCQLLLDEKSFNSNKAKYWCELAESEKVQDDAVFSLRLKLTNKDNLETNQVEDLIQKEIAARPYDVQLRVRLLRNYVEQNKILDAFKYVYNLELSPIIGDTFATSSEWYNIVWLVLSKYEQMPNTKKDWEFWLLLAICLERQVNISFTLTTGAVLGGVTETANLLFNLDQYLFKISQLSEKFCAQKELVALFLNHYRGQLLLHAAALIFKRELQQNKNKWKETVKAVLPLLLLAFQIEVPDNKEPWMKHCDEQGKHLIQVWQREGAFRCAQVGRTLLSCISDEAGDKENGTQQLNNMLGSQPSLWTSCDELLAQLRQICGDKQWRRNVFVTLFCNSDQKVKEQTSLLVKSSKLAEPVFELPTYAEVERFEEMAQYLKPQSLHHMVYLCLGNENLAYVRAKYFSGLNFSTQNLAFCGAESLNQLDMETFLYAAAIQAKRMLDVEREVFDNYNSGNQNAAGKPRILLYANLQNQLCNEEQANWWIAAYQVYKNLGSNNLAELRANLQYGIEAVRGINGPKVDMPIVFRLGQIFVARAQDIVKPIEKAFLESRAESIYKYGLNMLKMHNKGVLEPFRKYFKYAKTNSTAVEREVCAAAEDAVSYLAARYFKKAEYEELIEELAGIQLPFATYLQAEAYRKLDEANKTPKKAKRMYLDRASECLNQTLTLLKSTHIDPNHPLNSVVHAELKRLQQSTAKFLNDTIGTHNSSTYEDAEADYLAESPLPAQQLLGFNRSRRETSNVAVASPRNNEMESLIKQMANTLSFVKNEICDTIKPEVQNMHKEITSLKEKLAMLEEAMKKSRITSNPPSRDDASNVLDDLYIIEDALQNQLYPQSQLPANNMYATPHQGTPQPQPPPQQQRMATPNALQMQPNVAAAYNPNMFNPNYPLNLHYTAPYMMQQQPGAPPAPMMAPRNPLLLPYMEAGAMNFNMPDNAAALLPAPAQTVRPSNLYGLLTQQQQQPIPTQMPQLSVSIGSMPMQLPVSQTLAPGIVSVANTTNTSNNMLPPAISALTPTPSSIPFNKAINNQPVEKGPPANVVITSSDPLPNPNSSSLQTQQQTLSVTIPSHHIKPSLVPAQDNVASPIASNTAPTGGFTGFGTIVPFAGFGNSIVSSGTQTLGTSSGTSLFSVGSNKAFSSSSTLGSGGSTAISTTTFTFKPQIMQAALQNQMLEEEEHDKGDESGYSNDFNKSGTEAEVEYDPRPDFAPIIPLPDEIEVRTGEEDEEIMFCYRAKLYRYVDNEWKERGIGDMKILKNKQGSSRILMRRDQTHKVCANHKITKELKLTPAKNEAKGYIWAANDFADEELRLEKFFVRFKLPETATQFHDAFKKAQKEDEELDKTQPKTTAPTTAPAFGLAKSAIKNFATSTPTQKTESSGGALTNPLSGQTSTISTSTTIAVTSINGSSSNVSKTLFSGLNLTKNAANNQPSEATKTTEAAKPSPFANFSFGSTTGSGITPFNAFGSTAMSTNTATATATTTVTTTTNASPFANIFNNLGKGSGGPSPFSTTNLPGFQSPALVSAVSASKASPVVTATADTSTGHVHRTSTSDAEDDYVPTAQFMPVIPLPDLVEVATGEENEVVLFEHRAKLLRFDKEVGEWKERGLGNIKLLQDKDDVNKVRLLMRREQVHKLCCNQRLLKNTPFKYANSAETALSWAGQDFSENELITETLTVRFKTAETCKQFREAVLQAQSKMTDDQAKAEPKTTTKKEESSSAVKGFGDAFKPKAGAWTCEGCYISNTADKLYCVACDSPKDNTVPKKEPAGNGILATKGNATFNFGFAAAGATTTSAISSSDPAKAKFTFGATNTSTTAATSAATITTTTTAPVWNTNSAGKPAGFGDAFKPKAGSWTCQGCYVTNEGDKLYCVACDSPKDDTVPKKEAANDVLSLSNPTQKFSFGFAAAGLTAPTSSSDTKPNGGGFSFGLSSANKTDADKSPFASLASATASSDPSKTFTFVPPVSTSTSNVIGKSTFSFSLPTSTATTMVSNEAANMPFSLDKRDFNFTLKPKSPGKGGKSPMKFGGGDADADDGDDGDYHEEEENNTYFTPVIPLPDKIDVKTGEENEELLYVHRAKLYRFVDNEWKERGLGDVKILRHKETKKLRVVMRRDQVLKICMNHMLNEDIEYKRKDDKSWLFVAHDFSEGEVSTEKFSLRFKTKEIAEEFMAAVKDAVAGTAVVIESSNIPAQVSSTSTNIIASQDNAPATEDTKVIEGISDAQKKMAEQLKLPNDFYAEQPKCAGCRGCNPDDFIFPVLKSNESFVNPEDINNPLSPLELPAMTVPKSNRIILKQSALSSPSKPDTTAAHTGENVFAGFGAGKTTVFGSGTGDKDKPAAATFSFTAALNSTNNSTSTPTETKNASGGFLFGSANTGSGGGLFSGGGDKKPLFSQTPSIFGGGLGIANANTNTTSATEAPKSIFGGGSIFGGKPVLGGASTIFGGGNATSESSATADNNTTPVFGSGNKSNTTTTNGSSIFGTSTTNSIFSQSFGSKSSIFNTNTSNTGNGNGNVSTTNASLFGSVTKTADTTPNFAELTSGTIDFASLAASATSAENSNSAMTTKAVEKPGPGGFIGLTGQNAFSNFLKPNNSTNNTSLNTSKKDDGNANESFKSVEDDSNANEDNYDPHYEPIIALPNEIVVTTGEEEETKLFGERAKLFRYDDTNKEWKERGVGELKILLHPEHKTYRLILRREQIHKLVLNHGIGSEFSFKNMDNNPKSFVWAAMNYAESAEGELEKLAVRFKNLDIAERFSAKLNECIEAAKQRND